LTDKNERPINNNHTAALALP